MVKANDTDVVIALRAFPILQSLGLEQLMVAFDQGQSLHWITVHDLGQETVNVCYSFMPSQAVTLSVFHNKGKKTAWQPCDICPDTSPVFSKLSHYPLTVEDGDLEILEKFVILMYDRSGIAATMDEARFDMFCQKAKSLRGNSTNQSSSAPTHQMCRLPG